MRLPLIAVAIAFGCAPALAQESAPTPATPVPPITGTEDLPRDLSPWGMFLHADPLVQAVLIGLVFASVATWTVWLAKSIELLVAGTRARRALRRVRIRALPR
jgi:biopolymer transport protein ExbB